MTEPHQKLSDTDLQLYQAGLLPRYKQLLMKLALAASPALRQRLEQVRQAQNDFFQEDFPLLERALQPVFDNGKDAGSQPVLTSTETDNVFQIRKLFNGLPRPVLVLACVTILAAGIFLWQPELLIFQSGMAYIDKGRSLGVHVYHKAETGGAPRRITGYKAQIAAMDTLQVRPIGGGEQSLALYSWDETSGLSAIFPLTGDSAGTVTSEQLPPGLVSRGTETTWLICVTCQKPFATTDITRRLSKKPFTPVNKAPSSFLDKEIYFQIYRVEPTE